MGKNKQVSNILLIIHPDKINFSFLKSSNKIVNCSLNIESVNIQHIPSTFHSFYLTSVTLEEFAKVPHYSPTLKQKILTQFLIIS